MINALKRQEPSIDEMLASIRQIIESGENGAANKRPAASRRAASSEPRSQSEVASPADPVMVAANLDPSRIDGVDDERSERPSRSQGRFPQAQADEPLWPDAPGEPANDLVLRDPLRAELAEALRGSATDVLCDELRHTASTFAGPSDFDEPSREEDRASAHDSIASARHRAISLLSGTRTQGDDDTGAKPYDPTGLVEADDAPPASLDAVGRVEAEADVDRAPVLECLVLPGPPERVDFFADFDEEQFAAEILGSDGFDGEDGSPTALDGAETGDALETLSSHEDVADAAARVAAMSEAAIHALVSREAGSRISASFDDLNRVVRDEHLSRLDGTVREMLRPLLQDWLDDNLPRLVERLVREEIERVARGPRR